MAKISLSKPTAGYNLAAINDNFTKLEAEFQNKVLYRNNPTGEPNMMEVDLDMNGRALLNIGALNGVDVSALSDLQTYVDQAAVSATTATAAASSAASSFDSFDDRYLGAKANDPTTDNDGNPLIVGAIYFNSSSSVMRAYTSGGSWTDTGAASPITITTQRFSGNGVTTGFTLSTPAPSLNAVEVFISGVAQYTTTDFTVSGTALTFTSPPPAGTNNIFVRVTSAVSIGVPSDGTVTQLKLDPTYEASLAKVNQGQQFTAAPYTQPLTDNDLSFDISAKLDFVCTPTAGGTLTFTNIRAGAKGDILFVNNSNYTIAKAATVKASSSFLTTISATGRYIISYRSLDGTNVDVVASAALS